MSSRYIIVSSLCAENLSAVENRKRSVAARSVIVGNQTARPSARGMPSTSFLRPAPMRGSGRRLEGEVSCWSS